MTSRMVGPKLAYAGTNRELEQCVRSILIRHEYLPRRALMLPADVYWKVKRPEEDFGARAGNRLCTHSAQVVGDSIYLVSGFPLFAGQKLLRDLRHSLNDAGSAGALRP
jgi:hypothetical protein